MVNQFRCLAIAFGCAALSSAAVAAPPDSVAELAANIFSAGATIAAGSSEAVLTEVTAGEAFILTQYCQSEGDFGPKLRGSTFGVVPSGMPATACTSYSPGVLFRGGQTINCGLPTEAGSAFRDIYCMVTGYKVQTKH